MEPMHTEPALYPGFVDVVVAKNNKIRERLDSKAVEYNGICVSVGKNKQKVGVPLPEYQSVFIIQSSDLSHIFG